MFIRYRTKDRETVLGQYKGSIKSNDEETRNMIFRYNHHLRQINLATIMDNKEVTVSTINNFNIHDYLKSNLYEDD